MSHPCISWDIRLHSGGQLSEETPEITGTVWDVLVYAQTYTIYLSLFHFP
jgi:hypothetical protein